MNNFVDLSKFESQLENFDNTALQHICKTASDIMEQRGQQRKRELWGNVRKAVEVYQKECGNIQTWCRTCGEDGTLDPIDQNKPGWFIMS